MRLKNFQTETLSVLGEYLKLAREFGAKDAFEVQAESLKQPSPAGCVVAAHERSGRGTYLLPEELRSIQDPPPYVCLRVPTGGGKTLLASYAVGLAFGSYFEAERGFVLWLAPSKEIVVQTLNALRNPRHPYRLGLQEGLGSTAVQVVSVPEALSLNRADVEGSTIVVVGTVQAWRVTNQEGRKVFEDSGRLLDFQESLSAFAAAHPGVLQPKEGGRPLSSLGNLIASRRPLMILDEAHNMGSRLSFEALRDLNPRCILEFTATPDRLHTPSNVLHQVRAVDVKKEGMIKLPIEAESAQTPQEALLRGCPGSQLHS